MLFRSMEFYAGRIPVPSAAEQPYVWECISKKGPVVFRRARESEPLGETLTKEGLPVQVVEDNLDPRLKKKPGEYWLDFPLLAGEEVIGKICLQCDASLLQERLDLLSVLSKLSGVILGAILQREEWVQRAAEKAISIAAHNIATRFAGMALLTSRYRLREEENPGIAPLNRELEEAYRSILSELNHTKEMLRGAGAHREWIEVDRWLRTCLAPWLTSEHYQVNVPIDFRAFADRQLLQGLMSELIKNSLDAASQAEAVTVQVDVESFDVRQMPWVRIIYRDNGPGVPDDLKRKIFQDFYSYRPLGGAGQGLGLTYVRRAAAAHGGRVRETGE